MAKEGTKAHELALKDGDRPLKTAQALKCLAMIMQAIQEEPPVSCQFAVCDVDWDRSFHWAESPYAEFLRKPKVSATEKIATPTDVSAMGPVASFFTEHL